MSQYSAPFHIIIGLTLSLTICVRNVSAAPADYGDKSNPKTVPFQAEIATSGAQAATRTGTATTKIADMVAVRQHKYKKGASAGEFATLVASDTLKVVAQVINPWSDCMDIKIRGFCGRRFRFQVCLGIFGCVTIYSMDLPTSWYREYFIPVGMADTTNVRGATAMQLQAANWPLVTLGQNLYQYFAERRVFLDPLRTGRDKRATLPELELRRTYKGGLNAAAHRGITGLPALNLDTSTANFSQMVALQQLARAGRDTDHRIGNPQDTGQGYVTATWQTPPGYPVGAAVTRTLDILNNTWPFNQRLWMPVIIPLVFNDPYPYPAGFFYRLFQTCHCRRSSNSTHFVGSEYPVPSLTGGMTPPTIIPSPLLIPNLMARSPGISQWYATDPEWLAKMNMQLGSTAAGGLIGDPMSALNADIVRGGTPRNFAPVAGTIPDMFGNQIIKPTSGILPGTYRGIQHGWINIGNRVQQASNAAASEEALLKAFKFAHMIWPKEYYNVTPYNISDSGKNADKIQWTHGKLHDETWGMDSEDEDKTCKWIGHFNTEFKNANHNDTREDVWNVGHLWKKVRCCNQDHPISFNYFGLTDRATDYPQLNQDSRNCANTPAQ